MGTTVVSVYPYQLGHENDKAIESGAFWFLLETGFRPGRVSLLKLSWPLPWAVAGNPGFPTIVPIFASGQFWV